MTHKAVVLENSVDNYEDGFGGTIDIPLDVSQEGLCDAVLVWPEFSFSSPIKVRLQDRVVKHFCSVQIGFDPQDRPHFAVHGICLLSTPIHIKSQRLTTKGTIAIRIAVNADSFSFAVIDLAVSNARASLTNISSLL